MRNLNFSFLVILLWANFIFASGSHCGTEQLLQHARESQSGLIPSARIAQEAISLGSSSCTTDDYIDSVYTRKTAHFQIFYTLDGPHKTTEEFIDSLANDAEYAWNFYVTKLGMRSPKGIQTAYHYQQDVDDGLYPIEVIDIDLMRNKISILGRESGFFGVTFRTTDESSRSELTIDNDFLYAGSSVDTLVTGDGKKCTYSRADQELRNEAHNYSYADHWEKALRVTAVHELYHAIQLGYLDLFSYTGAIPFWFEASASGMEEIVAPDVDDYYQYLPTMFKKMGTPLNEMVQSYGAGIFLIYLYNFVDKSTDKFIWEYYAKNPSGSFQDQFGEYGTSKDKSVDSIFNDFATRLSLSGSRSSLVDSSFLITDDEKTWPDFAFETSADNSESFDPSIKSLAYKFHSGGKPNLLSYSGSASLVLFKEKSADVHTIETTNDADVLYSTAIQDPSVDSIVWILSKFGESSKIPTIYADSTLHAYPMPWREGNLCFAPLPENKKFVEIRNRRGDLVMRFNYDGSTSCLDETTVKNKMAPGIYRFRAGSSGKTKDFLVIY